MGGSGRDFNGEDLGLQQTDLLVQHDVFLLAGLYRYFLYGLVGPSVLAVVLHSEMVVASLDSVFREAVVVDMASQFIVQKGLEGDGTT